MRKAPPRIAPSGREPHADGWGAYFAFFSSACAPPTAWRPAALERLSAQDEALAKIVESLAARTNGTAQARG